ncbi:MAG TPA: S41 family peptidase [Pyrinomonadaceae bacterium]|nr:S41 family peptidase [Pyrinomonadaceae bacterium]
MRKNYLCFFVLLFSLLCQQTALPVSYASATLNLKVFDSVWKAVNENYFDLRFNGVDWARERERFRSQAEAATNEQELYSVINRMLGGLRDSHTFALSPTEILNAQEHIHLDVGLIGRIIENRAVYTRVLAGSSAQAAGIQPGWILTHIDGAPVDASSFRGFAIGNGETRRLRFLDAEDRVHDVELLARPFVGAAEQRARMLDNDVLYIRFESFYIPNIGRWFAQTITEHHDARALIVDLRGNWGGFATELQKCMEQLYAQSTIFGDFIDRKGKKVQLRVSGRRSKAFAGRVVVLIDEDSYSAAEQFAAAIQDSGRGQVVGRTSKGSALNNEEENLPDGGRLYLSVRDYVRRNGRRIEGQGVQPDAPVVLRLDDLRRNIDRDLERAMELIKRSS